MLDPDLGWLIIGAMSLLLFTAAWHKWRAPREFELNLGAYQVLPARTVPALSRVIPALEAVVAAALLLPATRSAAAWGGVALLLLYAGGIAVNLRRGRTDVDCGCAGPGERRPIASWMVARNLLLAAALIGASFGWTSRPAGIVDSLSVGAALVVVSLLYASMERLLGQIAPRASLGRRPS